MVGSRDSRALLFGLAVPRCYKLALYNTLTPLTTIFFYGSLFFFGTQSIGAFLPSVFTTSNTPAKYIEYFDVPDTQKSQIKLAFHPACLLYTTLRARPLPPYKQHHTRATISVALH